MPRSTPASTTTGVPFRPERAGLGAAIVLVAALVTAVHWPVLSSQALALDDNIFVTDNPLVTRPGWNSTARFFGEVLRPSTVGGYYLPLAMTSLMADWALGGRPGHLAAFHRTHLVLHVVCTVLVLLILHHLVGSTIAAACAALLFGLHPLTVEPLAWISERKTLLATCFALASVFAYLRLARHGRGRWLAASLAAYVLALLSKPAVVSLPLVLVALDVWPLKRTSRATLIEKWPYLALSAVFMAMTIAAHVQTAPIQPRASMGMVRPFLQIAWMLAFYAGKVVWPVNLTFEYVPPEPYALTDPAIFGSVALVVAIAACLVLLRRRLPSLLAGALVFVAALAPTFAVVQWSHFIVYDRYLYFPALGLALMVAGSVSAWLHARLGAGAAGATVVAPVLLAAALLAAGTRATHAHWRDSVALWTQVVRLAPGECDAHNGLAIAYEARGDLDAAEGQYRAALALDPIYPYSLINLGQLLTSRGEPDRALEVLRYAESIAPRDANIARALGAAEWAAGRLDAAEAAFRRALEARPDDVSSLDQLGTVLAQRGAVDEGVALIRRALALAPNDAHPHFSLAAVLLRTGSTSPEAVDHLRVSVRLRPDWAPPANELAWLLATSSDASLRDGAEALRLSTVAIERASRRDANFLDTHAAAQAASGRFGEADATAREALALAEARGDTALADAIRVRLALYQRGRPYVEAPAGR